jgi:hypothetical protein
MDILPNDIQDEIFNYVGYKEQFNKVLQELKLIFKVNNLLNHNNQITTYYINHYLYYNDN